MAKPFTPPLVYHNGTHIFFEFTDHVQRFEYTVAGLAKALHLIPHMAAQPGYVTGKSNIVDTLIEKKIAIRAKSNKHYQERKKVTEGQRRSASEAIRRMRMKGD